MIRTFRVVLVALLLTSLPLLASGGASAVSSSDRWTGGDRYATAAAISSKTVTAPAKEVVIATGASFPDALAGGPYVATQQGSVLLVQRDAIPDPTSTELQRLTPKRIRVLGGASAVSDSVLQQLKSYSNDVERIAGGDRFATAALISAAGFSAGVGRVYIAVGTGFPDALAGGAAAAASGAPLLLVSPTTIPQPTRDELSRLSPKSIVVLGGPGVISDQVVSDLQQYTTGSVRRLAGSDRYTTAVAVAKDSYPNGGSTAFVATGLAFPDALAGAPAAGGSAAPLLLVPGNCVPDSVKAELDKYSKMVILGGQSAVSNDVAAQKACPPPGLQPPNEAPRATIAATVSFSGSGRGYAAYLNVHDTHANAVAMGAQSDTNDPPSGGRPVVHANVVRNGVFSHVYGGDVMNQNESHRWELRYYDGAGKAMLFVDNVGLLQVDLKLSGRLFFQTEVNAADNGDHVDATYTNVVIGGTVPGGNGHGTTVEPNGTWNTKDFDFWGLDMEQSNKPTVQGANMRGVGTLSGLPPGTDWHTIESYNHGQYAGRPTAGIGMIAEYWFGQ